VVSAQGRREAVGWLRARGFSERRSCRLASLSRCGARYTSRKRANDEQLAGELRALAARYKRFGYRRAHAVLRRDGQTINHKRVARVWRVCGFGLAASQTSPTLQAATPDRASAGDAPERGVDV
jgi:putative transposase